MSTRQRQCGRPTKRTPKLTKAILESISDGLPLKDAAALAGISYETFCEWRRRFPEFSEGIEKAMAKGVAVRLKIISTAALKGDINAAKWWLEHVKPESFAKSRIEVAHQHDGTVNHTHSISADTLKRIAEARRRYESGNAA